MKKLVIKDGFAFIYFLRSFYDEKSILSSIEVYSDFFSAELEEFGKYFVLKLKLSNKIYIDKNTYSLDLLALEFMNYVLSCEYNSNLLSYKKNKVEFNNIEKIEEIEKISLIEGI